MITSRRGGTEVVADDGTRLRFEPLGGSFGAIVRGVDLAQPVHPSVAAAIEAAFVAHHLLCFPEQEVGPEDELRALRLLNEVSDPDDSSGRHVPGYPQVVLLSNIPGPDGEPIGFTNTRGMEWHTDGSGWLQPPVASLLYALEVPGSGGETYFANGHLAYETLPAERREALDGLVARYSWVTLQRWLTDAGGGGEDQYLSEEDAARYPDVDRPLVRTHPVTGRKALFFSIEEIMDIGGMGYEASRQLMLDLIEHMTTTPHVVYRHDWEVGDLVLWDNRCLIHSVCEYNYEGQRRLMHQITGKDLSFSA